MPTSGLMLLLQPEQVQAILSGIFGELAKSIEQEFSTSEALLSLY